MNKFLILFYFFYIVMMAHTTTNVKVTVSQNDIISLNNLYKKGLEIEDTIKLKQYSKNIFYLATKNKYEKGFAYYYFLNSRNEKLKNNIKNSIYYCKKAIDIFKRNKDTTNYLGTLAEQVDLNEMIGNLDEAKKISEMGLLYIGNKNYFEKKTFFNYIIGNYYLNFSENSKALSYLEKALYYCRRAGNKNKLATIYNDIATIYMIERNLSMSKKYSDLTIKSVLKYKINYPVSLTVFYNLRSNLFLNLQKIDSALLCAKKAHKFINDGKLHNIQSIVYANNMVLAKSYLKKKMYKNAIYYATKTDELYHIHDNVVIETSIINGESYYNLGFLKKALRFQKLALKTIERSIEKDKYIQMYRKVYEDISKTEMRLNDYKNAYEHHNVFVKQEIASLKKEKNDKINELLTKYEVREKDLAYKNLLIVKQKKEIDLNRQRNLFTISFIIIISLVVVSSISWIANKKLKKKKLYLEKYNKVIKNQNEELTIQQNAIETSLREKEILLKEIHHRVKNNLQIVMSLLNIQARDATISSIDEFVRKSQSRIDSIALIHQNLYETENLEKVNFYEYLTKLINHLTKSYSNTKQIKIKISSKGFFFNVQTALPLGLIVNELVTNSIKHASTEELQINLKIELISDNKYRMIIKDNGIGFILKNMKKKSLGLELVSLFTNQLNGKMEHRNVKGSIFIIYFSEILK